MSADSHADIVQGWIGAARLRQICRVFELSFSSDDELKSWECHGFLGARQALLSKQVVYLISALLSHLLLTCKSQKQ